jgi:hypothetical protein
MVVPYAQFIAAPLISAVESIINLSLRVKSMCFSATASFAGGVIISVIGVAVVTKVHKPSQLLFACIPLFFGLQQFTEGVLWLAIPNPEYAGIQRIGKGKSSGFCLLPA